MTTKEDADNLLYESKEDLVDMLCTQSELVDDLYLKIERLKAEKDSLCKTIKDLQIANTHWIVYHKDNA